MQQQKRKKTGIMWGKKSGDIDCRHPIIKLKTVIWGTFILS